MKWTTGCPLGIILLVAATIIITQAELSDKAEQPTAKECRDHVEAALKQYWEHPGEEGNPPVTSEREDDDDGHDGDDTQGEQQQNLDADDEHEDDTHEDNLPQTAASLRAAAKDDDDINNEAEDVKKEEDVETRESKNYDGGRADTEEITKDAPQENEANDEENEEETKDKPETSYNGLGVAAQESSKSTEKDENESEADENEPETDEDDDDDDDDDKTTTNKTVSKDDDNDDDDEDDDDDDDDDDQNDPSKVLVIRTRQHIEDIMGMDDIGTEADQEELALLQTILKDLKRNYDLAMKPLETIYRFKDISTRVLGDAEIFSKPMVLFIGPWSGGKSSIINYLLGVERTASALKSGPEPTDTHFTVVTYGEKSEILSGTEMAADWSYSSVQKFGQGFLDHFRGIRMPHRLLQRVTFVDTPGIIESRKTTDKGYPFNDAFQWFIDRADVIYIVFDPTKLEIGQELDAVIDQLKGREAQIRFILNKADTIRRNDVMKVTGQLFWNLSPLLGSSEAPVIYSVSMMTKPFHPGSPARFLLNQEKALLHDLRSTLDRRVENRIAYSRRHAVRVRNHAKMVDCYLATYFRHKSIFKNNKKVAESITENPHEYSIYAGLSALTNVSRYDLPDPEVYKVFFRLNTLVDFKPLSATCSYFKGCPLDKLDIAIAYDLPELLGKYKKQTKIHPMEWEDGR